MFIVNLIVGKSSPIEIFTHEGWLGGEGALLGPSLPVSLHAQLINKKN